MAQVLSSTQVKLNDGKVVSAQQGGWYDGQQFWGGALSNAGTINSQSNQVGAGQAVSKQVVAQTNPANVPYLQQQPQTQPVQPVAPQQTALPGGATPGANGAGMGITAPATIDLNSIYQNLYKTSGIEGQQTQHDTIGNQILDRQKALNDATAKINDNPFYSEATRVGRVAKLNDIYNNDLTAMTNQQKTIADRIATSKADIETQLNLQTKQFDINSAAASQALDQFNTLLSSGALTSASGEDIANLTRSTGLSSSMIQSAVQAQKDKNRQTSTISFDDGTNQGFAIIDTNTGEIINRQTISQSKPQASGSGVLDESRQIDLNAKLAPQYATQAAKIGKTLPDMMATFQQYGMSPEQIYSIYNSVNYYKATPAQIKSDKKKFGIK